MPARTLLVALVAVLALATSNTHAGGWAVVTVEHLPVQFIIGQPTELKFAVRQHGMRLVPGLTAGVSAFADGRQVDANAQPAEPGHYKATLTLPQQGKWIVTIHSGFGASALQLRPIEAVAAGTTVAQPSLAARGLDLFVGKGCNSCHYHADTKATPIARVGEDLTGKNYSDALLSMMLTNPSMIPKRDIWEMPDLKLQPQEVAALVAFIKKPRTRP